MTCNILVVEDSPTQAAALDDLLAGEYAVTLARSGEEALERIGAGEFALVLSDVVMPGITGYELCHRIKANPAWRGTPVVLLTSLADPMDIVRGLEAGADNYITKPYEAEHLLARLRHVLGNRRLRRSARTSMGVSVNFLGRELTITSDKEQILDLLLSSIEDVIRANRALEESRQELADAHARLETYAREKAQEARVSAERYRTLMQNAGDAICVLDADGAILEANARTAGLLDRPLHAVVGRPLESFLAPAPGEDAASVLAVFQRGSLAAVQRDVLRPDGTVARCEITASVTAVGGQELALVICRDVTERREAEEALRKREAQLAEAQKIARVGSWERDLRTNAVTWSDQAYRTFGLDPASGGLTYEEFVARVHPEDRERVLAATATALRERGRISAEFRIVWPDGTQRTVHERGQVDLDADGVPQRLMGTLEDVTEQRLLELQLRQAQKMEAVGRLAGGVAHDFNNLLTVINGNVQLLLADAAADDPARAELEETKRAVDRAAALTRQLLAFSRRQVMQPRVVAVRDVVREIETLLRRLIGEDIEFVCRLEDGGARVRVDPGQLEQVITNLAVNARDAMPGGGTLVLRTKRLEVGPGGVEGVPAFVGPGCYTVLAVRDTGHGMDAQTLERVFEPFFTTKAEGRGTGLGLSTVYGIVKQSEGYVWIESEPGAGTRVFVCFPLVDAPVEEPFAAAPAPRQGSTGERVLLVEDEPEVRALLTRVLRRAGYRVHAADDAEAAVRDFEEAKDGFDVLLTDVVMPRLSGRELIARLHALRPDLKVLFMSGYTDDALAWHGVLRPGVHLIEKPFDPDALVQRLREVLAGDVREQDHAARR